MGPRKISIRIGGAVYKRKIKDRSGWPASVLDLKFACFSVMRWSELQILKAH
jgi:hypothetical protein